MLYLVLSDIHANWEALNAVLADAAGRYDAIVNCGDIVGYGPDPNLVADWCRKNTPQVVRGNHDKACAGLIDLAWFNPAARASAVWTNEQLSEENREWLRLLPTGPGFLEDFEMVHGSPAHEDEYIVEAADAESAVQFLDREVCLFGHTHVQCGFLLHRNGIKLFRGETHELDRYSAYLLNPGSVGQPRDGDRRAAYAIYDSTARYIEFRRADYAYEQTQVKILQAGLPEVLAMRLARGS